MSSAAIGGSSPLSFSGVSRLADANPAGGAGATEGSAFNADLQGLPAASSAGRGSSQVSVLSGGGALRQALGGQYEGHRLNGALARAA